MSIPFSEEWKKRTIGICRAAPSSCYLHLRVPGLILILDKIVQFIEKAPPDGVAEYVIFGIENHIFPSHVIL